MHKIGILSRDVEQYLVVIKAADLTHLDIVFATGKPQSSLAYSQIDILFGDPDLTVQIVEQCTNLKWLQSTWAGNTPLLKLGKRNYHLTGVKDVFHQAMSEYVFAYLLYFSRNLAGFERAQANQIWLAPTFSQLAGKTLGIMGVGSIGQSVAKTAKAFDMRIKGLTRTSQNCEYVDQYYHLDQLQAFASELDYLLCLLPDTPATFQIIDAKFLAKLPKQCVLINAGRGQVIDNTALLNALHTKQISAAVLDVFNQEPLPSDDPFWQTPNLYITQHTAAVSYPKDIGKIFVDNYHRYQLKQPLSNLLDFSQGY
jgi:phosphoglycerate dehydrogenase-like enzyme